MGVHVGTEEGCDVGIHVGTALGIPDGTQVGTLEGCDGMVLGTFEGTSVGTPVGVLLGGSADRMYLVNRNNKTNARCFGRIIRSIIILDIQPFECDTPPNGSLVNSTDGFLQSRIKGVRSDMISAILPLYDNSFYIKKKKSN